MQKPDPVLLADWLERGHEPAFHELAGRYAGLVHTTARRTCPDESLAAEVSQFVFISLARKARSLGDCASLGGWLHRTTLWHAANLTRKHRRELRKRELLKTAIETESRDHSPGEIWWEIQPVLDSALAALSAKDREALLLRFYRSLNVREVAETLGTTTPLQPRNASTAPTPASAKNSPTAVAQPPAPWPPRWPPGSPPMPAPRCRPFPYSPPKPSLQVRSDRASFRRQSPFLPLP